MHRMPMMTKFLILACMYMSALELDYKKSRQDYKNQWRDKQNKIKWQIKMNKGRTASIEYKLQSKYYSLFIQ